MLADADWFHLSFTLISVRSWMHKIELKQVLRTAVIFVSQSKNVHKTIKQFLHRQNETERDKKE